MTAPTFETEAERRAFEAGVEFGIANEAQRIRRLREQLARVHERAQRAELAELQERADATRWREACQQWQRAAVRAS